jgi:hypothetical protein
MRRVRDDIEASGAMVGRAAIRKKKKQDGELNTGLVHSRDNFLGFRVFGKEFVLGLLD